MGHVLLLEPNKLLADQYEQYLRQLGHSVQVSSNAQDGVNQVDQQTPDLVILELLLAAHSGIEFLYELRSYSEWRDIPVILLSRIPFSEVRMSPVAIQELGVTAFLYKPETTLQRLGQQVSMVLPHKLKVKK